MGRNHLERSEENAFEILGGVLSDGRNSAMHIALGSHCIALLKCHVRHVKFSLLDPIRAGRRLRLADVKPRVMGSMLKPEFSYVVQIVIRGVSPKHCSHEVLI